MLETKLDLKDFEKAVDFAVRYYLDPSKTTAGRTSGQPRFLGAILDDFISGKLNEIGVQKILSLYSKNKLPILNMSIGSVHQIKDEPDIIKIREHNIERPPKVFIEIKSTSEKNNWISLTQEQFDTIKHSAQGKHIYIIYSKISTNTPDTNRQKDLLGMFMKNACHKTKLFQHFSNINTTVSIKFVLSNLEFENPSIAFPFQRGMKMYNPQILEKKRLKTCYKKDGSFRKDCFLVETFLNFDEKLSILEPKQQKPSHTFLSNLNINGDFHLIKKGHKQLIETLSEVQIKSDLWGNFSLPPNNIYNFTLETLGRDPFLKQNNLFISKFNIPNLIKTNKIKNLEDSLRHIANTI